MTEEIYTRDILTRVHQNEVMSQRSIAREMGIALGLANLLLKRMANKGLIRLVHVRPNRVLYFITPSGIAEKTRMTLAYVSRNVQSYRETRDRVRSRFAAISREWPDPPDSGEKRLVFWGSGEVAEIGYVCLQDTDLRLTGVVDTTQARPFFGHAVRPPEALSGMTLDGQPFGRLAVMSLAETDGLLDDLARRGVPVDRACLLF